MYSLTVVLSDHQHPGHLSQGKLRFPTLPQVDSALVHSFHEYSLSVSSVPDPICIIETPQHAAHLENTF